MEIGIWLPLWEELAARAKSEGIHALDEDERLWLYLRQTIDEIEHNGLLGLYCADSSPEPPHLIAYWQAIGGEDMANVFERAAALVPDARLPEDDNEREALIALWQQDAYAAIVAELEDDFYELLPEAEELLDEVVRRVLEKYA